MAEPRFPTKLPETDDGAILFSVPFPTELDAESLAALKEMAPIIGLKTGEAVLKRLQVDWMRVVQFN